MEAPLDEQMPRLNEKSAPEDSCEFEVISAEPEFRIVVLVIMCAFWLYVLDMPR